MKTNIYRAFITLLFAIFLFLTDAFIEASNHPLAQAQPPTTECYRFIWQDDVPFANSNEQTLSDPEVWCYRNLESPAGSRLIFHVDDNGKTAPELTLLISPDGSMTHASLLKGKLTIHRVSPGFSPLPIPLEPPKDAKRVTSPLSLDVSQSSQETLNLFSTTQPMTQSVRVTDGNFKASVEPESMPWRGYWFPHKSGRMHSSSQSAMAKFDSFVQARTGLNPNAQSWERRNHRWSGIDWSGHCNGWAAASVLRKEPTKPWTDPFSGVTFTVSDLKGLLIERDYCPKMLFFGGRFRGRASDNPRDIHPKDFHNVLTYYIGQLKKPVLMDYSNNVPVENRAVSGYEMKIIRKGPNTFRVATTLRVHSYDTGYSNEIGVANSITKTYTYSLTTDSNGIAVNGSWSSSNPDFLWVPLSPGSCKDGNPAITEKWIQALGRPIGAPW